MELLAGLEPAASTFEASRSSIELQERKNLVGEDRVELSPRVPKTRMLALHHTPLYIGGTERTRTVIGLIDNQVPHLSATVPYELGGSKGLEPSTPAVTVRCSTN